MLDFKINKSICVQCGHCEEVCPAMIIDMEDGYPAISSEKEEKCYRCQHCFTVCQSGALSILGLDPAKSELLNKPLIDPALFETFIKGRRSIRRYGDEDLDPALIRRLVATASYAPSGRNERKVLFTVIDKKEVMVALRAKVMAGIARLVAENALPPGLEFFASLLAMWEQKKVDVIFRGAPHMIIASAPKDAVSPLPDCIIALSYFDLFAESCGVGTVWSGLAKWAVGDLLPEVRTFLGIPEDHVIGYAMAFGKPAVTYMRTAQRGPANVNIVGKKK